MRRLILLLCSLGAMLFCAAPARAHDLPLSYVDLHLEPGGIDATIESSAKNFARELPGIPEASFLDPAALARQRTRILSAIGTGLTITSRGAQLHPQLRALEPLAGRKDLRLRLHFPGQVGESLQVRSNLFAADPRHRTFLNIYQGAALRAQGILNRETKEFDYRAGSAQSVLEVVRRFLAEGIHHIFIGPDHILFIVGLLLLGGTIGRLLQIVTAFTIAHSITLVLATLGLVNPPPRLVESAIALSIVFVGAHALLRREHAPDWRLLFAFCFGFVHGFGFANVLRAMDLPRAALGWSLASFNGGVEIGQACIVLAVAPLLAWLQRRNAPLAGRVVTASSFAIIVAGSFWLMDRLFPA